MIRFNCRNVKMFCRDDQTGIQQQEDLYEETLNQLQNALSNPQSKVVSEQTVSKSMARTKAKSRVMSEEYNSSSNDEVDQMPVSQSGEGIVPKMVGMVKKSANYFVTKSDKGIVKFVIVLYVNLLILHKITFIVTNSELCLNLIVMCCYLNHVLSL